MLRRPLRIGLVCTGNVFRSTTAEFALRSLVGAQLSPVFHSAGTRGDPEGKALPRVGEYLALKKLDISGHKPRLLTADILRASDLVIAMGEDHRAFIEKEFGKTSLLFMEVATGQKIALPDVPDVIADHRKDPEGANRHIEETIDTIMKNAPAFLERLPLYLKSGLHLETV